MLENNWYSVISPESCYQFFGGVGNKEVAAEALKLTADDIELISW